jgi:cellulose synthase/poly-beta-1,6-N-acetylglucosamine synthase-like glycosyltransferase
MTILKIIFWISFFCIVYSYVIYPVLLRVLSVLFKSPVRLDPGHEPTIAILIPAYNEEKVIGEKLANLRQLDYPAQKLTIWVGSDCSTDHTHKIVNACADPRVRLWIAPHRMGKTEVLNRLISMTDAEIVLFTDADIIIKENSLRSIVRHFADPKVGGVAGNTIHAPHQADKKEEQMYRSFEADQKHRESMLHSTISAFGSFYAIRRELFKHFPPNTYSNDDVLMPMHIIRQGRRMIFDPDAVSWEKSSGRIRHEFQRRIRIGAGNFQAFFWLLDFLNPLRGWPWFCYVSHKVSRWFSPFCIVAALALGAILAALHTGTVYALFFWGTMAVVAFGVLYPFLRIRPVRFVFYFLSMNTALIIGFFRYMGGIRSAAWSRAERMAGNPS